MIYNLRMLLSAVLFLSIVTVRAQINFTESASSWGINHQSQTSTTGGTMTAGSSVSAYDFTGDGLDDLVMGIGPNDTTEFYINTGSSFQKIAAPVVRLENTRQILWVDYDNDGDKDLFIAHQFQANRLYRNDGNFNFNDVTAMSGLPIITDPTWSVAFGDYDRDGWLDIFVCNYLFGTPFGPTMSDYLFRNKGDGTFEDITLSANIPDPDHAAFAVVFADYDKDFWPDIFIAVDKVFPNRLYHNDQSGSFTDVSAVAGVNQVINGMGIAVGDYDNDNDLDFYATGGPPVGNVMLNNQNNGIFQEVTQSAGTFFYDLAWGCNYMDFDNDTDLDLYVSGSMVGNTNFTSAAMFENNNATFTQLGSGTIGMAEDTVAGNAQAIGDFNNDGYPDIVVNNQSPYNSHIWINNGGNANWLKITLEGTASNVDGIGAFIEIFANGAQQTRYTHCGISFMAQNSQATFVGLDTASMVDSLKVYWPSGHVDQLYQLSSNQSLYVIEGSTAAVRPQIFARGEARACPGQPSAELYASGRFNSYLWSTGETTARIQADLSGWYSVTTTDAQNRTMTSDSFWVDSFPSPQLILSASTLDCFGDSDASIFSSATGGSGPISYQWSTGASSPDLSNLSAGNYSLVVEDTVGCTAQQSITINQPAQLAIDTLPQAALCQGVSDGRLQVSGQGGLPPYQYSWSTGASTTSISGLAAGSYQLTLSDANACIRVFDLSISDSIQLQVNTLVLAGSGGQANGRVEAQVNGGLPPYSYLWSDGQSTVVATGLPAGSYTVTVTDAQGCEWVDTAAVPLFISTIAIKKQNFKLFPNPSQGTLYLQSDIPANALRVFVVNVLGQQIQISTNNLGNLYQLQITDLHPGIYFINIYNNGTFVGQEKLILYSP